MPDHRIPDAGVESQSRTSDARDGEHAVSAANAGSATKPLAYVSPQLTHLGRVRDLTAGANSGAAFDGIRSKTGG